VEKIARMNRRILTAALFVLTLAAPAWADTAPSGAELGVRSPPGWIGGSTAAGADVYQVRYMFRIRAYGVAPGPKEMQTSIWSRPPIITG
jgi:hypothetical protein